MSIEKVTYTADPSWLPSPANSVYQHLRKVGNEIEFGAKRMVGVKTGALRASITSRVSRDGRGWKVTVGSELPYALMHHEGTRHHVILPVKGRYLRFTVRGRVVYARRVMHPGTSPNRYLTTPLALVVAKD